MTTTLPAKVPEMDKKASQALQEAHKMEVSTNEAYELAAAFLKAVKGLQKEIEGTFKPVIDAAHTAHKQALAAKKKHSEPLEQAERLVKGKVSTYLIDQEKKRRAEEARLRAEAEKKAEDERLARAVEAADFGDSEEQVETILNEEVPIAPVVVEKLDEKIAGISTRGTWKHRVVNKADLPEEYKMADDKKIGQVARAMKSETRIKGVEVWEEKSIGVRA